MSDEALRELERRWRETGAVEDEAAYLVARRRAGDLDPERLRLAAYCRHPAARLALDEAERAEVDSGGSDPETDIEGWVAKLVEWGGPQTLVRAALAATRAALPVWEAEHPNDDQPRKTLEAADAAFVTHSVEGREVLGDAVNLIWDIASAADGRDDTPAECAAYAVAEAGQAVSFYVASRVLPPDDDPDQPDEDYIVGFARSTVREAARAGLSSEAICAAIRSALLPSGLS